MTDDELEALYASVMSEMILRQSPELWPELQGRHGPLAAAGDDELLGIYRSVHDEMMERHRENPGVWGP